MAWFEDIYDIRCLRPGMANITLISAWTLFAPACLVTHPHTSINVRMLHVRFEVGLLVLIGLLRILVVIHTNNERIYLSAARRV